MNIIKNISKTKNCIIPKNKYNYMSPVEKPIISIPINSIIESSAQIMQLISLQTSACSQISVFGGAVLFRIGIQLFSLMFKSMEHKEIVKDEPPINISEDLLVNDRKRFMTRWIDKIFIVDMIRDYRFNKLEENILKSHIKHYYTPSYILGSLSTSYLLLNFMRGGYRIIVQDQFALFNSGTLYLPSLASHDPHFYLPIVGILLTYHLLKNSTHPFLINMRRPQNKISCFNIAFMVGLALVPIPGIYQISYMGMVTGHCVIRYLRKLFNPLKIY